MREEGRRMFFTGIGLVLSGMLLALLSMIPTSTAKKVLVREGRDLSTIRFGLRENGSLIVVSKRGYFQYNLSDGREKTGMSRSLSIQLPEGNYTLEINGTEYSIRVEEGHTEQPYLILSIPAFLITVMGASVALRSVGYIVARGGGE